MTFLCSPICFNSLLRNAKYFSKNLLANDKDNHNRRIKEYIPAGSKESMDSWLYIYSYLNVKRKQQPDNSRLEITAFCFPGFFLEICFPAMRSDNDPNG